MLVVNIIDEAERVGMRIDIAAACTKSSAFRWSARPSAASAAWRELRQAIADYRPRRATFAYAADLEKDIQRIAGLLHGDYRLDAPQLWPCCCCSGTKSCRSWCGPAKESMPPLLHETVNA